MGNKPEKEENTKPVAQSNSTVAVIGKLKKSQATLQKREKHLEAQITQALRNAKAKMKRKDKRGAVFQLKRKKMLEKRLNECQGMQLNLEQQIFTLEKGNTNEQVAGALRDVRDEMKNIQSKINVDDIENIRDDLDDARADQEDITNILSEPMGQNGLEDDELEGEFAELMGEIEEEDVATSMTKIGDKPAPVTTTSIDLPDVDELPEPVVKKPVKDDPTPVSKDDAAELAELEAMMAA
jgi:charged multivesicular body protein 4A/B